MPSRPAPAGAQSPAIDPQEIVRRARACLPASQERIALHEPRFGCRERDYVLDCIETNWVSYAGAYVTRFEAALAERCGATDAIAVSNGTVALQLALQLCGVAPGDEVLVPALTFVATANAVVHAGAVPHFVDVEETTLGIDPVRLRQYLALIADRRDGASFNRETGRRIAAIVPVHVFGHPADMDALHDVARIFGLLVVEDAAEALGSRYKGRPCGSLSLVAALSFNGNKLVTTGGGGAVVTSDRVIAARARTITTTAKTAHPWAFIHTEVAYNFRLPNLNAALGLAQLEKLDAALAAKRLLWARYFDAFQGLHGVKIFRDAPSAESNHWLTALLLDEADPRLMESALEALNAAGIGARPAWTPMHQLSMYADNPRMTLSVTESLAARIINLPSSPFLAAPI